MGLFDIIHTIKKGMGKLMNKPTQSEIDEYTKMGENTPTTKTLTRKQQDDILKELAKADIKTVPVEVKAVPMVNGQEECPHCDNVIEYTVAEDSHTVVCPKCGKVIPLCSKCKEDHSHCDDCIWCDVSNFYNYLRGNISIEKFLANLNPSLTDMTTCSNPIVGLIESTYDNFLNDVGGDDVTWDLKYWDIYGMVVNTSLTPESSEEDVLAFVKAIIKKNRE